MREQKYFHGKNVADELRNKGVRVTKVRTKDGRQEVYYADISNDEHLEVVNETLGPGASMYIVAVLASAGILVLLCAITGNLPLLLGVLQ